MIIISLFFKKIKAQVNLNAISWMYARDRKLEWYEILKHFCPWTDMHSFINVEIFITLFFFWLTSQWGFLTYKPVFDFSFFYSFFFFSFLFFPFFLFFSFSFNYTGWPIFIFSGFAIFYIICLFILFLTKTLIFNNWHMKV